MTMIETSCKRTSPRPSFQDLLTLLTSLPLFLSADSSPAWTARTAVSLLDWVFHFVTFVTFCQDLTPHGWDLWPWQALHSFLLSLSSHLLPIDPIDPAHVKTDRQLSSGHLLLRFLSNSRVRASCGHWAERRQHLGKQTSWKQRLVGHSRAHT